MLLVPTVCHQVLNNGSAQSQSMAVDVLALVLEIGPSEAATVLLDAGVVQSLISMLLSPSALVQQQAVGLVSIMSARYFIPQRCTTTMITCT